MGIEIRQIGEVEQLLSGSLTLTTTQYEIIKPRPDSRENDPWSMFHIDEVLKHVEGTETDILKDLLLLHFGWREGEVIYQGKPKMVLDVDETLFNSVEQHWKYLNKLLPLYFGWDPAKMPTYEAVCEANGTHKAYKDAAPTLERYDEYKFLNDAMRFNDGFNRDQVLIEGAREALEVFAPTVLCYLTTRPESLTALTYEELIKHGYPDREVVARPDYVPLDKTSFWKILNLALLSFTYKCAVVMIDDSVTTHEMIEELRLPHIKSILIKGPMTPETHPHAVRWSQIVNKTSK